MDKSKRIIFNKDDGIPSIIIPGKNSSLSLEEIIQKSVPKGKKYKIEDVSEIPSDRTFRDAWEIDESELTDGVGE